MLAFLYFLTTGPLKPKLNRIYGRGGFLKQAQTRSSLQSHRARFLNQKDNLNKSKDNLNKSKMYEVASMRSYAGWNLKNQNKHGDFGANGEWSSLLSSTLLLCIAEKNLYKVLKRDSQGKPDELIAVQ